MGQKLKKEENKTRYEYVKTYDQDYVYNFKLEDGEPIALIARETSMRKAVRKKENQRHMTWNISKDRPRKMFSDMEIELVGIPWSLHGLWHLLDIQCD